MGQATGWRSVPRRLLRMVAVFLVVFLVTPLVSGATVLAAYLFLPLPPTLPEPNPTVDIQLTRLYDITGAEIGLVRQFDSSVPVEPSDIPEVLKQAVVAAEDRNFYSHGGVDFRGTLRAAWNDIRAGEAAEGGSTITQQYVKNTYTEGDRTVSRKLREAILASQLDRQIDKDEILYRYLSSIYLGEGAYGVGAAAETYFRKTVNDLTLSEAALLAGLIPAPSRYSPRADPAQAEAKRLLVLDAMLEEEMITSAEHHLASVQPVWLTAFGPPPGPATLVHPPELSEAVHPWFQDYVRRYVEQRLGDEAYYRGGLRIETTLDPVAQYAASGSVAETLAGTDPEVQMAIASVEPPTGYVRALVGGRDFAVSSVNRALGAGGGGTDRPPGSSFKPFVLAAGFEAGIEPDARYSGAPHDVAGSVIGNYGGARYGTLDLRTATRKSVNTAFSRLILDVGVERTFELTNRLGIDTVPYDPSVHGASVALGVLDASPLDMASAFGVFAAGGRRAEPTPVLRVLDRDGNVLIDNTGTDGALPEAPQVLDPVVADNVTDVLRGVTEPGGTANGKGLDRPSAGKTGTSQDNHNAWFVGYTPTLSTAVWMGYDQPRPLHDIAGVSEVTGGSIPASVWQRYMIAALEPVPITDFNEPAPIRPVLDEEELAARGGFDVGSRRRPAPTDDDVDAIETMRGPSAQAPTTAPPPTTTTTVPSSSSTTTIPGREDGDDEDDEGEEVVDLGG